MTQEEFKALANKIAEVAPDQLPVFIDNPDAFDYNVLEGYSDFTNKYKNIADFKLDKPKIMAEIYQQFDGKFPSNARFQSLLNKYNWLNKEELKEWFDKTNNYKELYEKEREAEFRKAQRKQEVDKEWGFLDNLLASEYSKQRYIDNPDASIFGKEGKFNPYSTAGQEELTDVILGGTGAVADLLPGVGALVAPTVRLGRDVYHNVSDSEYKKDIKSIIKDAALDYGTNSGAWLLANARKGAKAANELASNDVKRAINFANEDKAVKEGLSMMQTGVNRIPSIPDIIRYREFGIDDPFNDIVLKNTIMDLPESSMKRELIPLVSDIKSKPINRSAVQDIINKYNRESMKPYQATLRQKIKDNRFLPEEARQGSPYLESAIATKPVSELTKLEQASYLFNILSAQLNKGRLGQTIIQEGATLTGRNSSKPNLVETALQKKEKEDNINRIINNYSLLWNKKSPPPEAKDSPLIKAAWERWSKE